jgi:hypothetical protein
VPQQHRTDGSLGGMQMRAGGTVGSLQVDDADGIVGYS